MSKAISHPYPAGKRHARHAAPRRGVALHTPLFQAWGRKPA